MLTELKKGIPGRCLCKAIHITVDPPTHFVSHCHCESCRKAHASAFVTWTRVSKEQFNIRRGEDFVVQYESSPGSFRCFCKRCGTAVYTYYSDNRDQIYVPMAVLDEPIDKPPESHVSYEEKVDWYTPGDDLPRFHAKSDERLD